MSGRSSGVSSARNSGRTAIPVALAAPVGPPEAYDEHVALMFDLLAAAFQVDTTRVFTFMMMRDISSRSFPHIGVSDPHHALSHEANGRSKDPQKPVNFAKVNTHHVSLFAKFVEKLEATPEGDGSLLDHSMVLYGSAMGNANDHTHHPLPLVVVGGGSGQMKKGWSPSRLPGFDADREPAPDAGPEGWRRDRSRRHQHGPVRHVGRSIQMMRARDVCRCPSSRWLALAPPCWRARQRPLIDAVKSGNRAAVQRLIRQKADVNAPEPDQTTALHWAVRAGDAQTVSPADSRGREGQRGQPVGVTPMSLAAANGDARSSRPCWPRVSIRKPYRPRAKPP